MNSEEKSQAQSGASTDHPPPVTKRQTAMAFQRCDPEQIHQSLLAAIRSGEAAAKLKRVSFHHCIHNNELMVLLQKGRTHARHEKRLALARSAAGRSLSSGKGGGEESSVLQNELVNAHAKLCMSIFPSSTNPIGNVPEMN